MNMHEAIHLAFEDSRGDFATGYPGFIASDIINEFSNFTIAINERSALAMAHIHSYLGKRSITIMKNAGLNDAALPFRNACDLGTNAGMVIIVTDDTQGYLSENRQDSRYYADLGKTLLLEPKSPSETYHMVQEGFKLSETYNLPILVRITNSLHNRDWKEHVRRSHLEPSIKPTNINARRWVLHPQNSLKMAKLHKKRFVRLRRYSENSTFNSINGIGKKRIIYSQALTKKQAKMLQKYDTILKIGTFPVPIGLVRSFISEPLANVHIMDDGEGYLEEKLKCSMSKLLIRNKTLESCAQNDFNNSSKYVDLFNQIRKRRPNIVVGDFGSYTLSSGSPIEYALYYGGSLVSGVGASIAGVQKVYTILGDGAFTHGLIGLTEAVRKKANVNYVVIDNGGISGRVKLDMNLEKLAIGQGIKTTQVVESSLLDEKHLLLLEKTNGPSVLIVKYY